MAVTTGKVRLSFCHLWEPYAQNPGDEPKYSVTILIPKTDTATLNTIYAEMAAAEQQGVVSKWNGVKPPIVKNPLYDGDGVRPSGEPFGEECKGCMVMTASSKEQPSIVDLQVKPPIVKNPLYDGDGVRPSGEPFGEECKGCMVMTASSKEQPSIVDLQVQPILNRSDVYSGCYARVSLNFFPYASSGNKGIGCGLNAVQKLEDGETLAGRVSAQEAFGGANAYAGVPAQPQTGYVAPPQPPQPQAGYGMPPQPPQPQAGYMMPPQPQMPPQIDPITGQPILTGGIMGIS